MPPLRAKGSVESMLKTQIMIAALFAVLWTTHPAFLAATAYLTLSPLESASLTAAFDLDHEKFLLGRKVQLHFLKYRIYIPIEDISFTNPSQDISIEIDPGNLSEETTSCNSRKPLIWVPFRFKVPVIGERVIQWCLKIPLKNLS